jgi:polyhydroxyalkanoate synthesis regulator protein
MEDHVRRNMEMMEKTFSTMFAPFGRGVAVPGITPAKETPDDSSAKSENKSGGDFDEMTRQLEEMQKRLDRLSEKDK